MGSRERRLAFLRDAERRPLARICRFGRLTVNALAQSGHTVYASMRGHCGRNAAHVKDVLAYGEAQDVDLRVIELDVTSDASVDLAVSRTIEAHGRLDVVVYNAGRRAFGQAEAFTSSQIVELFDVNVLSTQRVNRAALPFMRQRRQGRDRALRGDPTAEAPVGRHIPSVKASEFRT